MVLPTIMIKKCFLVLRHVATHHFCALSTRFVLLFNTFFKYIYIYIFCNTKLSRNTHPSHVVSSVRFGRVVGFDFVVPRTRPAGRRVGFVLVLVLTVDPEAATRRQHDVRIRFGTLQRLLQKFLRPVARRFRRRRAARPFVPGRLQWTHKNKRTLSSIRTETKNIGSNWCRGYGLILAQKIVSSPND